MNKPTPEEYRQFVQGLELLNITLMDVSAKFHEERLENGLTISIKSDAAFVQTPVGFNITNHYTLIGKNKDKRIAIKVDAIYNAAFKSSREIKEELFIIYKETSLPMNVWPFFRELVHSLTSRMNIPPLALPLLKS